MRGGELSCNQHLTVVVPLRSVETEFLERDGGLELGTQLGVPANVSSTCFTTTLNIQSHLCSDVEDTGSSNGRHSDLSFTNSRATSSLALCERILSTVQPVSSRWTHRASGHHSAQLVRSTTSLICSTARPTIRSSRAKQ